MMTCTEFKKWASPYVDHQLAPPKQRLVAQHLAQCAACQLYLTQLRAVSGSLSRLTPPAPPPELLSRTMTAFDGLRQDRETSAMMRAMSWAYLHSRAISAVASFLITITCYGGILEQLKSIPYLPTFTRSGSINLSASQYDRVNGQNESEFGAASYTFPRVRRSGHSESPLAQMGTKSVVVIVMIHSDGRASLVEVLAPAGSPHLVQQVQSALRNLRFRPATTGGRPVPTQLVLLVERVDVQG